MVAKRRTGDIGSDDWRCASCGRLLAVLRGDRLHIRFARGHEYLVGLPVACVCRNCRTLNERHDQGRESATS